MPAAGDNVAQSSGPPMHPLGPATHGGAAACCRGARCAGRGVEQQLSRSWSASPACAVFSASLSVSRAA